MTLQNQTKQKLPRFSALFQSSLLLELQYGIAKRLFGCLRWPFPYYNYPSPCRVVPLEIAQCMFHHWRLMNACFTTGEKLQVASLHSLQQYSASMYWCIGHVSLMGLLFSYKYQYGSRIELVWLYDLRSTRNIALLIIVPCIAIFWFFILFHWSRRKTASRVPQRKTVCSTTA